MLRPALHVASLALLACLLPFSAAQLDLGLSGSCQAAATSLVTTPFAACIDIVGLAGVFSASGSVVGPLDNWLHGACARSCSDSDLASAKSLLDQGCKQDIADGSALATGLNAVVANYTAARNLLCLEAKSNSSFCLPATLRTLESQIASNNVTDAVPSQFLFSLFTTGSSGVTDLVRALGSVPQPLLCTECLHALFTNLLTFIGLDSRSGSLAGGGIVYLCGNGFADLKIPPSVVVAPATISDSSSTGSGTATSTAPTSTGSTSSKDQTSGVSATRSKKGQAKRAALFALAGLMALSGGVVLL
ncbi:hypothetical protein BCR35DRAFT_343421 [Leucosporidium creatinivorum]|uniref:Uncharacterized protein n=1 Tax=Leucosporidium creatinivorum TaxID=106004 RepID=A0A1Y2EUY6_9BASI|nr:hypothetical protein BCR35DRAFT_343421 [Leucosporidium creatinivorum]